jgi:hypothetical protein
MHLVARESVHLYPSDPLQPENTGSGLITSGKYHVSMKNAKGSGGVAWVQIDLRVYRLWGNQKKIRR